MQAKGRAWTWNQARPIILTSITTRRILPTIDSTIFDEQACKVNFGHIVELIRIADHIRSGGCYSPDADGYLAQKGQIEDDGSDTQCTCNHMHKITRVILMYY
jgi:hypothetical protein